MKETLHELLKQDLTYTELRVMLFFIQKQLSGLKKISSKEMSQITNIDENRVRLTCRTLKDIGLIKSVENEFNKKLKEYSLSMDSFDRESLMFHNYDTNRVIASTNFKDVNKHDSVSVMAIKRDGDEIVDMVGENIDPKETDPDTKNQIDLLQRAFDRRTKMVSEDSIDPIESLKIAKENRTKHVHEKKPKHDVFSKEIRPDNQKIIVAMKKKYKRLKNIDNTIICVLYALKYSYPDVSPQNIAQLNQSLVNAIAKCIKTLGFDEVISVIRGRKIFYNGKNFSEYWIRQFINMPKYKKEGTI